MSIMISNRKRIFSFLIIFILIFSLFGQVAFAADYVMTTSRVWLRDKPRGDKIVVIPSGTKLQVLSSTSTHTKTSYNGSIGWVYNDYIKKTSSNSTNYIGTAKTLDGLNFRTGPSLDAPIMKVLSRGTKVNILSISGNWVKIKCDNKIGYVYKTYLETTANYMYVTASWLNLRVAPDLNSEIIRALKCGTKVAILDINGNWAKILYKGTSGYVWRSYLKK